MYTYLGQDFPISKHHLKYYFLRREAKKYSWLPAPKYKSEQN